MSSIVGTVAFYARTKVLARGNANIGDDHVLIIFYRHGEPPAPSKNDAKKTDQLSDESSPNTKVVVPAAEEDAQNRKSAAVVDLPGEQENKAGGAGEQPLVEVRAPKPEVKSEVKPEVLATGSNENLQSTQDGHSNINFSKFLEKFNFGERSVLLSESIRPHGIADALDSSGPISITESKSEISGGGGGGGGDPPPPPGYVLLGTLDLVGPQSVVGHPSARALEVINIGSDSNKFHFQYFYAIKHKNSTDQPDVSAVLARADVLAVIARSFLLSKISVCRRRLRLTLNQTANGLSNYKLLKTRYALPKNISEIKAKVKNGNEISDSEIKDIRECLEVPGLILTPEKKESILNDFGKFKGLPVGARENVLDDIKMAINPLTAKNEHLISEIKAKVKNGNEISDSEIEEIRKCLDVPGLILRPEKKESILNDLKKFKGLTVGARENVLDDIEMALNPQPAENEYLASLVGQYDEIATDSSPHAHKTVPLLAWWWLKETTIVELKNRGYRLIHHEKNDLRIPWLTAFLLVLTYLWLFIPMTQRGDVRHDSMLFVYCCLSFGGLIALPSMLFRKLMGPVITDKRLPFFLFWVLIFLVPIIVFAWLYPIDQDPRIEYCAKLVHGFLLGGVALAFLSISLNLRTIGDRIEEKIAEVTSHKLDEISSSISQNNSSVAALHINREPDGFVPETLLRTFDEVFQTKEAVSSLEKVIQARKRDTSIGVSHIKEHQQKSRRAATAAAGGVFTGFFTFEVGESVFKYVHFQHGTDDRSMFNWFATEAGHFANPDLKNERAASPQEVNFYLEECLKNGHANKACMAVKEELSQKQYGKLDAYFKAQYHSPELVAHGWLLVITLTVSLLAALIGWRKPVEEQGGGGAGHH